MITQWFNAVFTGDLDFIERYKLRMAKARNLQNQTALMRAVELDNIPVMRLLLDVEANEDTFQDHNVLTAILAKPSRFDSAFTLQVKTQTNKSSTPGHDAIELLASYLATTPDPAGTLPIVYAIENRHLEYITMLIEPTRRFLTQHSDKLETLVSGYTALMLGCILGDITICNRYRHQARSINAASQTALMISAMVGFHQGIGLLLQNEMRMQDRYGFTALMYSAIIGDTDSIRTLGPQEGDIVSPTGCTTSMIAAYYGHISVVSSLRNIGQYQRRVDNEGRSLLMYAMFGVSLQNLSNIIQECRGMQDNEGRTALMYAAERDYAELCCLLLPAEADIVDATGRCALSYALHTRSFKAAKVILGHTRYTIEIDDWSPLMLRVLGSGKEVTTLEDALLKGYLGKATAKGTTALMLAAMLGNLEMAKLLLKEVCMQESTEIGGRSALMYAIQFGHVDVATLLVDAENSLSDAHGQTALMYTIHYNMPQVLPLLLPHELCKKDKNGMTALIHAAKAGDPDGVLLLQKEAGEVDNEGRTALMYALAYNRQGCYKFLFPIEGNIADKQGQSALVYLGNKHLICNEPLLRTPSFSSSSFPPDAHSTPPVFKTEIHAFSNKSSSCHRLLNQPVSTSFPTISVPPMNRITDNLKKGVLAKRITQSSFTEHPWSGVRAIQLLLFLQQLKRIIGIKDKVSNQTPNLDIEPIASENLFSESSCQFPINSVILRISQEGNKLQLTPKERTPNIVLYPCQHFVYAPVSPELLDTPLICPKCQTHVKSYDCSSN